MGKWIVLDRDGVINRDSPDYIKSPDEWQPLPGALEAIADLTRNGVRLAVATNQSGVARGLFTIGTLARIHQKMICAVEQHGGRLEGIFFCPHAPGPDGTRLCDCRKPGSGMLVRLMRCFSLQPGQLIMVGDSQRDMDAARRVGITAYRVSSPPGSAGTADFPDLYTLVKTKLPEWVND